VLGTRVQADIGGTAQRAWIGWQVGEADSWPGGGRTWWAHFEFTRINIEPTILRKKIEERRILGAFCVVWRS
jgi:hypothetical protein